MGREAWTRTRVEKLVASFPTHGWDLSKVAAAHGLTENQVSSAINRTLGKTVNELLRDAACAASPKAAANTAELRDRVRALEAQIAAAKQATLSDEVVRREILRVANTPAKPPEWMVEIEDAKRGPGVPILFASDWHWGEQVEPREIGGVNRYDLQIAQERAKACITNAIDLLTKHMVRPEYPGIVFALGGDMLSGDIHEELTETNEVPMMPALLDLLGVGRWCLDTLADAFGNVFVVAVTGNHPRTTPKPRAKRRNHTNFDWLLYQLLAKQCEADKRIAFHIPDGPDALFRVYGHRYLLTHGDQFRGGDGMIGALGPIIRGDHKKRSRNGQIDQGYDTLLVGHWHQLIQMQRLIVCGSLKGYDEYAHSANFPFEEPKQALWVTHPERGITFSMPVFVDKPRRQAAQSWVAWPRAA